MRQARAWSAERLEPGGALQGEVDTPVHAAQALGEQGGGTEKWFWSQPSPRDASRALQTGVSATSAHTT